MNSIEKTARNQWLRVLPLIAFGLLAACGGSDSDITPPANEPPTAAAGDDQSVDANTDVTLAGSGTDSDGSIASYSWTQTDGTEVALTNADAASATFTAPDVDTTEVLSFELTVTDDDGATASDTVEITVAPVVTLSGRAYDGPIANATISVTVGDKTYTATADEDGVYTLDIGAVDPSAFITISATGSEGQEHVELVSIAGSFGALQMAAGDDGVLDTEESGSVNVTNLSTAKAVLMIEANGGTDITDDATLITSESLVSGDDVLYLATVIKLVIDGGYALPEGTTSTLDLVKDSTKTTAFVAAVDADDASAFNSTYNAIITDPQLVASFTTSNVPATLFTLFVSSANDTSLTYRATNRGKAWTFNANGTGTRADADYASAPFSWTITNGKIVATYNTPLESTGWCRHPDGGSGTTYWCESTTTATTFTLLVDGTKADTLLLTPTGETNYPSDPGLAQPIAFSSGSTNLGLQASAAIPFSADEIPGRWVTAVTGRADASVSGLMLGLLDSGFLEFQSGGAGERMATDYSPTEAFTWAITDGVLNIEYTGGDKVSFYRLRKDGGVYDTLALLTRSEGKRHSEAGLMLEVEVDRLPLLEQEDIPARYTLFEKPNDFSIRFASNGTGSSEAYNETVPYDTYPFQWILRDDYVVQMSYFWDEILEVDTANCSDVNACHLYLDRLWYPAAYDDATGRVYVLEIQQRYDWDGGSPDYHKGALNYYQPSVRYWGRTEFDPSAVVGKPSAPLTKTINRMSQVLGTPVINKQ